MQFSKIENWEFISILILLYIFILFFFVWAVFSFNEKEELKVINVKKNPIPEGIPPFWWEQEIKLSMDEKGLVYYYVLFVHIYYIYLDSMKDLNPDNSWKYASRHLNSTLLNVNKLFCVYKKDLKECNNFYSMSFYLLNLIHELDSCVRGYFTYSKRNYRYHKLGKDQTELLLSSWVLLYDIVLYQLQHGPFIWK